MKENEQLKKSALNGLSNMINNSRRMKKTAFWIVQIKYFRRISTFYSKLILLNSVLSKTKNKISSRFGHATKNNN